MDIVSYLARIGYEGPVGPTPAVLNALHRAHISTVPFENLDIALRIPIELDYKRLFEKVVGRNRGGFCYELNALFGWLLREIGFEVEMLSARVFGEERVPGPDFDHMLLRVDREFVADVGFGDSFTRPLRFESGEQEQETGKYRVTAKEGAFQLERNRGEGWSPQYLFTVEPRRLDQFEEMCLFQQTSPKSTFTRKIVCSKAAEKGRLTYANGRFIETGENVKVESVVKRPDDLRKILLDTFGIGLEAGYEKLLRKSERAPR
ncbi:MAG: arylamine N-acetyltransferase [Acidobacteriota bacterium]|nr:arylamine N-acetyltransferase [Acidobacteriota bacterium]